ncbi:hypothetical protein BDV28DRAFT_54962 [Aspergillus coremiiformis]|uniref:Uncharacterized protein n=1 Tax=Aspergillus coremiiformis TaxID=138285 RepID=A0A5N6YYK3_9EURO|nr:hypothetical protein BDV28DRAFT_54962 [Aspergillus coremiiformis]
MEEKKRGTDNSNNHSNNNPSPPKPNNKDNINPPSLTSRIQHSASGLARHAFSAAGSSSDAAQFLANSGKASSSSAVAAAEHHNQVPGPAGSSSAGDQWHDTSNRNAGTFRSATTPQQGGFEIPQLTEEEFAHGGDPSGDAFRNPTINEGKGKETIFSTVSERSNDGEAVTSLLSDPTFDPTFPPAAHEPLDIIETELSVPQPLTPVEIQMLEAFRRRMTPSLHTSTSSSTHRLTSASLVPDIDSILGTVPASMDADAAVLRDAVLGNLPGSEDWVAVEERYHDEVWGYLKPTLQAAAKEMEERKGARTGEDGPAVQRLKMILRHMQA